MRNFRACILWFLLIMLSSFKGISQKGIISYDLPSSNASGLTKFFFSYTPSFRVEKWKDHADLFVSLHLVMSTPGNMQSSYWYNYRYKGKEYGDNVVGQDVFNAIRADQFRFHIRVQGNSLIEQITYSKGWGEMKVGKVSLTAKPEDYHVFIEDLVSVDFTGTGPIENKIDALLAAGKQKALDEEKKKNDALASEKAAADKKKQDDLEKQKQPDAEKKKQAVAEAKTRQQQAGNTNPEKTNSTGASSSKADDDFWGTGKKSSSSNQGNNTVNTGIDKSKLPEFFRTTDGKYYHKDGDNVREVSYDDYMALKKQRADQKTAQQTNANKLTPEQQQKAVDDIMSKIKADQTRDQKMWDDINKKSELRSKAFAAGAQVSEAKEALRENSNLNGNYESVEQLMADFNQKMSSVSSITTDLESKRNTQVNAAVDANFYEPEMQAYGQGVKLIGSIVNSAKEAKERKEAQARLKAQKEASLAAIKAEETRLLTGIRTDLFKRFKEGSLPLSSTRVEAQTIYYFAYAYNPAQLGNKQATLFISNVFAIDRYSDGTWPFKNAIVNDLSKLTPYTEIIHGYYVDRAEAESMRKGMMDIFVKTGGNTTAFVYKGKTSSSSFKGGSTDFWENSSKKIPDSTSKEKKQAKKDDFWNN
jgi:hypothetical protein